MGFSGCVNRDVLQPLPQGRELLGQLVFFTPWCREERGGGGQSLPSSGPAPELAGDTVPLLQVVFLKRQ